MTYEEIKKHPEVVALLERGDYNLGVLGFTDHSMAHCVLVAERAAYILRKLGYSDHEEELAKIAGCMHDIGNAINRKNHAEYGALLANDILKSLDAEKTSSKGLIARMKGFIKSLLKLKNILGCDTLLLEGGSIINGAFLRAGAVDELSLVVAPAVAGGDSKPLFFDAEITDLVLESAENEGGSLVLRYKRKK